MTFPQLLTELKLYPLGVWDEVRKVTWPGPRQTLNALIIVIVIVGISTAIVGLLDVVFAQAIARLL
jgi:preprotein translocase SecE subunit